MVSNKDSLRASEVAYQAVRREILSGVRPEHSWLREGEIAEELGVSRTPVREAFHRLAAEGLVRHEYHRGVQVASWDRKQVDEIFGLRSVLEPWACSLAAATGILDTAHLQQLADDMDATVAPGRKPDYRELTQLNNAFHQAIREASDNGKLVAMLSSIIDVPLVHRTFEQYSERSLRRSLSHHHELVEAFVAGDGAWAESVMRSHVQAAWSTALPPGAQRPDDPPAGTDDPPAGTEDPQS